MFDFERELRSCRMV